MQLRSSTKTTDFCTVSRENLNKYIVMYQHFVAKNFDTLGNEEDSYEDNAQAFIETLTFKPKPDPSSVPKKMNEKQVIYISGEDLDKKKIYVGPFSKNDKESLALIKTMSDYVIKKKGDPEEEQRKFEEREAKKSKYHQVSDSICQRILDSEVFGKRVSVSTVSRAISEAALRAKRSEVEKLLKKPSEELWQEFADNNYDNIVEIIRTIKLRTAINTAARKAKKESESDQDKEDSDQDQDQDNDSDQDQDQEQANQETDHEVTDQEEEEEPKRKTRSKAKTEPKEKKPKKSKKAKTVTKTGISDEELENALSDSLEF